MDTVQGTFFARFRALEELDGVGVEREPLQELDCLLWEDVVELKDVDDQVDQSASKNEDTKEYDHSNHNPVACFKRDLMTLRFVEDKCNWLNSVLCHLFICCVTIEREHLLEDICQVR